MRDGRGNRDDTRRLAFEARLHLLELSHGNSHAKRLPATARRQKQKRRDVSIAALIAGLCSMILLVLVRTGRTGRAMIGAAAGIMRLALYRGRGRRRAVAMHRLNMLFHTRLAGCDELVLLQLRGAMLRRRAHRGRFVAVDWPRLQRLLFVQNILRLAMLIAARRP